MKTIYLRLLLGLLFLAPGGLTAYAQEGGDTLSAYTAHADSTETGLERSDALSRYADGILSRFQKSPLLVTVLYIVILYSIVTMVTLLIIILLHRRILESEQVLKEYLLEKYQHLLMNYLFD